MIDQTLTGPLHGLLGGPRTLPRDRCPRTDRFTMTDLSPSIGSVVEGVSLAEPLDAELFGLLDAALVERKVLFFRGQHLSPEQQRDFAAHWGTLESHPFFREVSEQGQQAEVVRLEKDDQVGGYENIWHSDVSWRREPSLGSVLRAVEVPPTGGDTLWADMAAAYDNLTDAMKERIDGLTAEHDWVNSFGLTMPPERREALRPDFPAVEHPVVRTHPVSGRKLLYVNKIFTDHLVGLDADEGAELLDFLCRQATMPEYQCRWTWTPGDVAFWDNRSTQHYAVSDYFPQRRVMERITVVGDAPR